MINIIFLLNLENNIKNKNKKIKIIFIKNIHKIILMVFIN